MDSLTHIVVGAITGEAVARRSLGKHGMLLGAVGQSLPDIDFIAASWLTPANNLLAHRAFTHSILFMVLASFFCALIAERWHRKHDIKLFSWVLFFALQIGLHLLFDLMNAYGIGLFEPFNHHRVSFNVLFVADPLFSVWPAIAFIFLLFKRNDHPMRLRWIVTAMSMSALYLGIALFNKFNIDQAVERNLGQQGIPHQRYFTTPTPLNTLLWYAVAESDSGCHVGYRSVFDDDPMRFTYHPRNDALLDRLGNHEDVPQLKRFSQGYYTVTQKQDTIIFNDLRFGQVFGWSNPGAPFVFQFYLQYPDENMLVMQRGRFANWNLMNVRATFRRMTGDTSPGPVDTTPVREEL